jgi:hypothetical protein
MGYDEDGGEIKMEFRGNVGEHIPAIWFWALVMGTGNKCKNSSITAVLQCPGRLPSGQQNQHTKSISLAINHQLIIFPITFPLSSTHSTPQASLPTALSGYNNAPLAFAQELTLPPLILALTGSP